MLVDGSEGAKCDSQSESEILTWAEEEKVHRRKSTPASQFFPPQNQEDSPSPIPAQGV